jgi:hypothetical protein
MPAARTVGVTARGSQCAIPVKNFESSRISRSLTTADLSGPKHDGYGELMNGLPLRAGNRLHYNEALNIGDDREL